MYHPNGRPAGQAPQQQGMVGVDDLVDLDNFLDSYLTQLQNETYGRQGGPPGGAAPGGGMPPGMRPQGMPGMPDQSAAGLQILGLQQQLGGGLGAFGLPGGGMPGQLPGGFPRPGTLPPSAQGISPMMASGPGAAAPSGKGGGKGGAAAGQKATRQRGRSNSRQPRKSDADNISDDDDLGDSSGGDSASSDGEPKSRKKREVTADEAERRHAALQEKNRRAQRRFRERQKSKLQELHKQIEDLTSKVSNLQTENAALHSRTSILEKVLDMRNEQIQVMQETKENATYPGTDDELASLNAVQVGASLIQLTPENIKELSSDQIYKIYQTYVKELSVRLVDVNRDQNPESPGYIELEKLVKDLSMMIMRLGVVKPLETRKFIVVSRQYLGNTEAEVIDLWKNVMKAIDLGEQQKRDVVDLKRQFLQKIEPIMEERKHLNVQIQSNLPHDTFHTKNALTYIKAHEAVIKLRDNLRSEQHVVLEFAVAVFRAVFKPKQMATLLVKCYPAVPDALGIASALASELGEPDSPHTHALAMQLGGYAMINNAGAANGGAPSFMNIHPTLLGIGSNGANDGQQQLGGGAKGPNTAQLMAQQRALGNPGGDMGGNPGGLPVLPLALGGQQQQQQMGDVSMSAQLQAQLFGNPGGMGNMNGP